MGNFSVNHYSKIELSGDRIAIKYIIDLAEIPTFQELQESNITASTDDPAIGRFIAARGEELARGLTLVVDGRRIPLNVKSSQVIFPTGAGGLPTMKMGFTFEAALPADLNRSSVDIRYVDNNYAGHAGWKEIIAFAREGSLLKSSAPSTDRSDELKNYPTDLLNSPPQQLDAAIEAALPNAGMENALSRAVSQNAVSSRATISPRSVLPLAQIRSKQVRHPSPIGKPKSASADSNGSPLLHTSQAQAAIALEPNRQPTPRSRFTELIAAQHLSLWFLATAGIIAIGLGALHALEPGHGKTIVAAYLVGSRGTARHALLLGLIVTASHTAGVFALGAITLYASRYMVPEQLYPWLGVLSGVTIAGLGLYMFLQRMTGAAAEHSHSAGSHGHWPFASREKNRQKLSAANSEPAQKEVSPAQLFILGVTGGIIPCPAALVVLLSAFALHRIELGFFLIVAFSLGLAAVLVAFGMLMVYARRFVARFSIDGELTRRWLPSASAAFIAFLGSALAVQAFLSMHLHSHLAAPPRVGALLFVVGLGLVLGMRHSTDPDHVVAISTIVTRQKSIRGAAIVGSVWGIGHTITIFIVGALIILFNVEIPPRLGLAMEFCVAIMLVVLGVLNLAGITQKLTHRLTPARAVPAERPAASRGWWLSGTSASVQLGIYQFTRPLVIGLIHGLAGSAAVALLVLSTIHNPVWATAYLLIFGAGTMVGMMVMTATMAAPLRFAGRESAKLNSYLATASGLVSLAFGSFLVFQLGIVGGLFTSHPVWTPR